jgi:hypothetical protein
MSVMNEATTNATTPKTEKRVGDPSKHAADLFELSRAMMSKFEMPRIEVPAEFREMTDKGHRTRKGRLHESEGGQRRSG